ncbi:hypothetical protein E2C01_050710 [Portunus trituberculatus]|uniref:Uncharacterized protein n=1 Tax=Portunus trituberculatus TaxID=210409 RepID=A0A5B7GJP2_PORTR|nr:hypothetical protein [Portunus trituberculatus]
MAAFSAFPTVLGGCVSYLILKETSQRWKPSSIKGSWRCGRSFKGKSLTCRQSCQEISASEGGSGPSVTLSSKVTLGKEWRVVSAGVKRRKVLRVLHHMETTNSSVLQGVEEKRERQEVTRRGRRGQMLIPCPKVGSWWSGIVR